MHSHSTDFYSSPDTYVLQLKRLAVRNKKDSKPKNNNNYKWQTTKSRQAQKDGRTSKQTDKRTGWEALTATPHTTTNSQQQPTTVNNSQQPPTTKQKQLRQQEEEEPTPGAPHVTTQHQQTTNSNQQQPAATSSNSDNEQQPAPPTTTTRRSIPKDHNHRTRLPRVSPPVAQRCEELDQGLNVAEASTRWLREPDRILGPGHGWKWFTMVHPSALWGMKKSNKSWLVVCFKAQHSSIACPECKSCLNPCCVFWASRWRVCSQHAPVSLLCVWNNWWKVAFYGFFHKTQSTT